METLYKKSLDETIPVQHDGEYVLTSDGSRDFGEISFEIARTIRRQAGKIRLRVGVQEHDKENYGEKHIERCKNWYGYTWQLS